MGSRLELHDKLLEFCPNAYFQPPSSITMKYPCIVYSKFDKNQSYGSNSIHVSRQGYRLTVIDKNPDSDIADRIEGSLEYCEVTQYFTVDNLNHTVLTLYY